tara:strand:+ start:773 stop:1555 length:783 start_codon:yes stop_codon:yes gene_type:complete
MAIIKVKTGGITADAVTDALIADDVVGTEHLTANEVDTTALGADAVTGAQLADDAVNSEHYTDGSIDTAHIADSNVTGAKLNTDVISAQTALTSSPADTDELLISDAGTLKRIDVSLVGGANTPIVRAVPSGNQSISSSTNTTVVFDSEVLDTDSAFASNTFTVPSGKAGKYYIGVNLITDTYDGTLLERLQIKKNTSTDVGYNNTHVYGDEATIHVFCIVDLSVGDTINANYYSYQQTATIKGNSEYANGSSIDIFKLI